MENRNGLVVNAKVSQADGHGERETAIDMLAELPGEHRKTVGADKNYDTRDFVDNCKGLRITRHVANIKRRGGSAIDERTTRHKGYETSQRKRKRVEEPFGWGKK